MTSSQPGCGVRKACVNIIFTPRISRRNAGICLFSHSLIGTSMNTVSAQTYAKRRREYIEQIGPEGVAILVANPEAMRSNDTDYPYRAASDILYLTGFCEPKTVLLIAPEHPDGEVVMFVQSRDPLREQRSEEHTSELQSRPHLVCRL